MADRTRIYFRHEEYESRALGLAIWAVGFIGGLAAGYLLWGLR